jgi:hypothetical protein
MDSKVDMSSWLLQYVTNSRITFELLDKATSNIIKINLKVLHM